MVQRKILLLVSVFAILMMLASPSQVRAFSWDNEYTDQSVNAGAWAYKAFNASADDTVSGYFETGSSATVLDFFICDEYNYGEWSSGNTSVVLYSQRDDKCVLSFIFQIPHTGTWYFVLSNKDGSNSVSFDLAIDINGDNSPSYSSTDFDKTMNKVVVDPDKFVSLGDILQKGTVISGNFSTVFSTDHVEFFICASDDYDTWISGGSITKYDRKASSHSGTIDLFTIPSAGSWYFVFAATGESNIVTVSFGINIDTSGAVTESTTPATSTQTNTGSTNSSSVQGTWDIPIFAAVAGFVVIIAVIGLWQFTKRKHGL
ncbi:MAG: hypothetical protein ACTSYL_05375 [Candidatus Thorarchaeota archaeon]